MLDGLFQTMAIEYEFNFILGKAVAKLHIQDPSRQKSQGIKGIVF